MVQVGVAGILQNTTITTWTAHVTGIEAESTKRVFEIRAAEERIKDFGA